MKKYQVIILSFIMVLTACQFVSAQTDEKVTVPKQLDDVFDKGYVDISYTLTQTLTGAEKSVSTMEIKCKNSSTYRIEQVNSKNEKIVMVFTPQDCWTYNEKGDSVDVQKNNPDNDFKAIVKNATKITEGVDGKYTTYTLDSADKKTVNVIYVDAKENIVSKLIVKNPKGETMSVNEISDLKRVKLDDSLFKMPEGKKIIEKK